MDEISLPFHEDFKPAMLSGRKTATTRTKRYGYPGDLFPAFGETFILTEVYPTYLDVVAYNFFDVEGFGHSQDFIDFWDKLHPRVKFRDNTSRSVFCHRFRLKEVDG